jgi:hypothetical protein
MRPTFAIMLESKFGKLWDCNGQGSSYSLQTRFATSSGRLVDPLQQIASKWVFAFFQCSSRIPNNLWDYM